MRNHLKCCVGANFEDLYIDHLHNAGGQLDKFCFNSTRDCDVFKLLEWLVMQNMPLSEVDDPLTHGIMNIPAVFSKFFRKYILSLIRLGNCDVKNELPSRFGVLFDGRSDSSIHYVGMFSVQTHKG